MELNACNGGCVGGVLTVENPYVAEVKLKRLRKYMPVARTHIDELSQQIIPWTTGVQYEPVFSLGNTMMESFSRLNQVEPVSYTHLDVYKRQAHGIPGTYKASGTL